MQSSERKPNTRSFFGAASKPGKTVIHRVLGGVDKRFLLTVILLVCFGSVMIFSAGHVYAEKYFGDSFYFVKRQFVFALIGIGAMILFANIDYALLKRYALPIFAVSYVLLLLVLIPGVGVTSKGATRWLAIGPLQFQPSEIAKFSLILLLAAYFSRVSEKTAKFKFGIFFPALMTLSVCFATVLEKHMSGTIIIFLIGACMIFLSGADIKWLGAIGGTFAAGALGIILFTDYTKNRIEAWLHPESDLLGKGWQPYQSLLSIGSGGLLGVGLGNSYQKQLWLPEPQNDFIFAIICEELGLIGAVALIALFITLIRRGFIIAKRAPDTFSSLLAAGLTAKVGIQAILNIAVVTASIPTTGIALPFFSYGGSALVMQLMEMGIILSISRYSRKQEL
ncbi:MAG: putative lipid II flippase FtsW [Clostridiales bacterium]|nr:putative lipid II flippase FtsW [Clostridiales bacterium]